jgi:hypothetical protein
MLRGLFRPHGHRSLRRGKQVKLHKRAQLLFVALIIIPVSRAQQSATTQSSPAAPVAPLPPDSADQSDHSIAPPSGALSNAPYGQASQAQPDTSLLSGGETFGLGSLQGQRRTFDPALQLSESRETGLVAGRPLLASGLGGSLNVEQHWGRYVLTIGYRGGETIYEPSYYGVHNLPYHDGTISQNITFGRWTLRLRDDVMYSWGSGFGGLFTGGQFQAGNAALTDIQPSLISTGTIQTGLVRQINNAALVEADYAFSRRTTVTFVGAYSFMHFLDSGYINDQDINGRLGYTYALSAKNNIGFTYDRDRTSFSGTTGRMESDLAQLTFGRKITGRLAFQVAAGPQLLHYKNFGVANPRQLSWSAFSALTYQRGHTGYTLSYFHGVTGGSGVLFGGDVESVTATANRQITRFWSACVNGGYAMNKAVVPDAIFTSQFNDWFAGANLNRQIGAQIRLGVSYSFQQETTGGGACPVLSCGLPGSFSQLGASLQWHPLARGR